MPAFLYLFCTHVPAHAVLFAPEAAALHVPRSASHAYSEQVGLDRQRLDTSAQRRAPPAVEQVGLDRQRLDTSAQRRAPPAVAGGGAGVLCAVALRLITRAGEGRQQRSHHRRQPSQPYAVGSGRARPLDRPTFVPVGWWGRGGRCTQATGAGASAWGGGCGLRPGELPAKRSGDRAM